jgi:hypothetical protein
MTIEMVNEAPVVNPTPPVTEETPPVTETKTLYTKEELDALHPTAIDLEKVDPAVRPVVEKTIKEYKSVIADHTRATQELAELKKQPEVYFADDAAKDKVFKQYLENPTLILGDIYNRISVLDRVLLNADSTPEQRETAQFEIRYWERIEKEFSSMHLEATQRHGEMTMAETKLVKELGLDALKIEEYAVKSLGFTERDFRTNPAVRTSAKKLYEVASAGNTAKGKETKPIPQDTAHASGAMGGGTGSRSGVGGDEDESNLSVTERIKRSEKRLGYS